MSIFNPIKTAVAPYLVWIKLGALALLIAVSFGGGCHLQKQRDDTKIGNLERANADLTAANRDNVKAIDSLKKANGQWADIAASKQAEGAKSVTEFLKTIDRLEAELKQAKGRRVNIYARNPKAAELAGTVLDPAVVDSLRKRPGKD